MDDTFSISELALRWKVSRDRTRVLIEQGLVPAFRIPTSGRFGSAIRIPKSGVVALEMKWRLAGSEVPQKNELPSAPAMFLRHFPELTNPSFECDFECPEGETD